jgi:hypothetical protein
MRPNLNLDPVRDLALDVWDDLCRTRMAGVSIGMVVTLLAVSAIVLRPGGSSDPATDATAAVVGPTREVALALPGEEPVRMADLKLSAPRNPFRSLDQLASGPAGSSLPPNVDAMTVATSAGSGGGGTTGSGSPSYDALDTLTPIDTGGDSGATSAPAGGSETAGGEVAPDGAADDAPATDYSFAADVQFGSDGALKRYASVQRLGFVPSRRQPLLMYLGVEPDHTTAMFMVDSRLSQGGEGKCLPSPSLCTFLEMSADAESDEHNFRDADGTEYLLRLRRVVRIVASSGSVGGDDLAALAGAPSVVDGTR